MAAIGAVDLQAVRKSVSEAAPCGWTKGEINLAVGAIDAWFDLAATRAAISAQIDAATAPKVFTIAEKKLMLLAWIRVKFGAGV